MIGYKITIGYDQDRWKLYLVELEIPKGTEIVIPYQKNEHNYQKCRCQKAIVRETYCIDFHRFIENKRIVKETFSLTTKKHLHSTYSVYEVGELISSYVVGKLLQVRFHYVDYINVVNNGNYTVYTKNKEITSDMFDTNPKATCSSGIHFFRLKEDCLNWLNQNLSSIEVSKSSFPMQVLSDANFFVYLKNDILTELHKAELKQRMS